MSYDALGCLYSQIGPGIPSTNYGMWAACDQVGRRTVLSYLDGQRFTYNYDNSGALTQIREGDATVLVTYTYDDLGRRAILRYANGVEQRYGYDANSRLQTLVHDLAGTTQDQTWSYAYNAADQIVRRASANPGLYDWPSTQSGRTYGVNGLNQLASSAGATNETYGYDNRGNLTSSGGKTYAYDLDNRLVSSSDGQLIYDPLGRLLGVIPVSGAPVYFAYDGLNLIAEYGAPGVMLRRYVHGPGVDNP
jgi:YD repeat-containing protein